MITYQATPDYYNEYIKHYGVMGMKWGIRKDLRRTGSISEKTKRKMKKALSKASYGKTRRMLNGLEDLKSDYKSRTEEYKSKNRHGDAKRERSNVSRIESISKRVKDSASKKGYKYDIKKDVTRFSTNARRRSNFANGLGYMLAGPIGGLAASAGTLAYAERKHKKYTDATKGKTSAYMDTSGVAYYKKKKK